MSEIIIFGGTTEGRKLAEYCHEHQIPARVCVTSEYGAGLLPDSRWLEVEAQPLSEKEISERIQAQQPALVLDATHPYAALVSGYVKQACEAAGVTYLRVAREQGSLTKSQEEGSASVVWAASTQEAVEYLCQTEGAVLLTTGSKELEAYRKIPDYQERLFVRVLPDSKVIGSCQEQGISGKHLIAMQGPFSVEMNQAMLAHTKARYLVTKEAGTAGGFQEKAQAAAQSGVTLLVIGRPEKPEGVPLFEALKRLEAFLPQEPARSLCLAGIGMGGPGQMTLEVQQAIADSQVLFGAPRMLESLGALADGKVLEYIYAGEKIADWLSAHPQYHRAAVVYSGDTGFYSGSRRLLEAMREHERWETTVLPGISTVSYLCAKLKRPWETVFLASAHGRQCQTVELVREHEEVFLLLGGEDSVRSLCEELREHGLGQYRIAVGARLSYPDEEIVVGSIAQMCSRTFDSLCAVLIVHPEKELLYER